VGRQHSKNRKNNFIFFGKTTKRKKKKKRVDLGSPPRSSASQEFIPGLFFAHNLLNMG
jgi:hypothetical protein